MIRLLILMVFTATLSFGAELPHYDSLFVQTIESDGSEHLIPFHPFMSWTDGQYQPTNCGLYVGPLDPGNECPWINTDLTEAEPESSGTSGGGTLSNGDEVIVALKEYFTAFTPTFSGCNVFGSPGPKVSYALSELDALQIGFDSTEPFVDLVSANGITFKTGGINWLDTGECGDTIYSMSLAELDTLPRYAANAGDEVVLTIPISDYDDYAILDVDLNIDSTGGYLVLPSASQPPEFDDQRFAIKSKYLIPPDSTIYSKFTIANPGTAVRLNINSSFYSIAAYPELNLAGEWIADETDALPDEYVCSYINIDLADNSFYTDAIEQKEVAIYNGGTQDDAPIDVNIFNYSPGTQGTGGIDPFVHENNRTTSYTSDTINMILPISLDLVEHSGELLIDGNTFTYSGISGYSFTGVSPSPVGMPTDEDVRVVWGDAGDRNSYYIPIVDTDDSETYNKNKICARAPSSYGVTDTYDIVIGRVGNDSANADYEIIKTWSVTVPSPSANPDVPFAGLDDVDVIDSVVVESSAITTSGVNQPSTITVSSTDAWANPECKINNGSWQTCTSEAIDPTDTFTIRATSASTISTPTTVDITYGSSVDSWVVTTRDTLADRTPDPYSFVDVVDASQGVEYCTDQVSLVGVEAAPVLTSISSTYSSGKLQGFDGNGVWQDVAVGSETYYNSAYGYRIRLCADGAPAPLTDEVVSVDIGGEATTWTITTADVVSYTETMVDDFTGTTLSNLSSGIIWTPSSSGGFPNIYNNTLRMNGWGGCGWNRVSNATDIDVTGHDKLAVDVLAPTTGGGDQAAMTIAFSLQPLFTFDGASIGNYITPAHVSPVEWRTFYFDVSAMSGVISFDLRMWDGCWDSSYDWRFDNLRFLD
jgi:hypothetical protein